MVRLALDLLRQYPLCLSLTIVVPRFVAETNDPDGPPLDPVGVALLTISLGLAIDALLRRDGSLAIRAACLAGSAMASLLFVLQQWRRSRPVLDPRVFATSAMAGVGALLTAIQFGYWAVLVYLPLFLSTALLVSIEVAGVALLAATLPMLMVPLIGGRLVTQWGWRCFFVVAFGIMAAGDALLALAAVSTTPCNTTPGKVIPTGPVTSKCSATFLTTSATSRGLAPFGVSNRKRSLVSWPVSTSTGAPLMPVPPM